MIPALHDGFLEQASNENQQRVTMVIENANSQKQRDTPLYMMAFWNNPVMKTNSG